MCLILAQVARGGKVALIDDKPNFDPDRTETCARCDRTLLFREMRAYGYKEIAGKRETWYVCLDCLDSKGRIKRGTPKKG